MASAMESYRRDMPKVKDFGVVVDNEHDTIEVTVYPAYKGQVPPFSVPGDHMAVSYIFDSTGTRRISMYYNR